MSLLSIAQIAISILVIIFVLLQKQSSGVSGLFGGGGGGGGFYQTRRGVERLIFITTIISIAVFAALALLNLIF